MSSSSTTENAPSTPSDDSSKKKDNNNNENDNDTKKQETKQKEKKKTPPPPPPPERQITPHEQKIHNHKQLGNDYFQKNDVDNAINSYTYALLEVSRIIPTQSNKQSISILKIQLLSNRAMCYIKKIDTPLVVAKTKQPTPPSELAEYCTKCINDCTTALDIIQAPRFKVDGLDHKKTISNVHMKLLYRRGKSQFMLDSFQTQNSSEQDTLNLLNDAAKDILKLLRMDPKNKQADILLKTIRTKHGMITQNNDTNTPVSKVLHEIDDSSQEDETIIKNLKMLLGLLNNDLASVSIEIGKRNGLVILWKLILTHGEKVKKTKKSTDDSSEDGKKKTDDNKDHHNKIRTLAIQVLSCSCSYPPFVWTYCTPSLLNQNLLSHLIVEEALKGQNIDIAISGLAIFLRLVLHLDNYCDSDEQTMKTTEIHHPKISKIDDTAICRACISCLESKTSKDVRLIKVTLDVLSSWTTQDRISVIQTALLESNSSDVAAAATTKNTGLPFQASENDIRTMKPREVATYKKNEFKRKERDMKWANNRSLLFCDLESGGLNALLQLCILEETGHILRREIGIVISRIISSIQDENIIKNTVSPILGCTKATIVEETEERVGGLTIEEIHDDYEEEEEEKGETKQDDNDNSDRTKTSLQKMMEKGQLTSSLLILGSLSNAIDDKGDDDSGKSDNIGTWALSTGWSNGDGLKEIRQLIKSNNNVAMFIASEVISSAASVDKCRPLIKALVESDDFEILLNNTNNKEIQSGAASAIAKLGLADKELSKDEGEIIGLLQVAVQLLDTPPVENSNDNNDKQQQKLLEKASKVKTTSSSTSETTTAIDRGIELLSYLSSKTQVKEEIAHGFKSSSGSTSASASSSSSTKSNKQTALEKLVELSCKANSGELLSSYGLATIFAMICVSSETLRREAFADREITVEQYDELQSMGKTEEEKEMLEQNKEPDDTEMAVHERIRKLVLCEVPRALISLLKNNTSEKSIEQVVTCLNRMSVVESVRGTMVQQGVLTSLIKYIEPTNTKTKTKKDTTTTDKPISETKKNTIRQSRHCIGKLLISINPSILTTSQRVGSIKPLLSLIRDHESSDLQQFESLMAVTNLASYDNECKNRIISERGISTLSYAMFSDHDLVRTAATESMCNLVPNDAMMIHLSDPEHLKLWAAFALDYEINFNCARAAVGCLAMSVQHICVASTLVELKNFKELCMNLLQSGNLELMHRVLVMILNLMKHNKTNTSDNKLANDDDEKEKSSGESESSTTTKKKKSCPRTAVIETGAVAFCNAYVDSYHDGRQSDDLKLDKEAMKISIKIAKEIVRLG